MGSTCHTFPSRTSGPCPSAPGCNMCCPCFLGARVRAVQALRHYEKATSYFASHGSYVDFVIHMVQLLVSVCWMLTCHQRRLGHTRNEIAKVFWSERNVDEVAPAKLSCELHAARRGRRKVSGACACMLRFLHPDVRPYRVVSWRLSSARYELAFKALKTRQTNPIVWKIIQVVEPGRPPVVSCSDCAE
eukprot:768781-Hanusia_phi.AAC.4